MKTAQDEVLCYHCDRPCLRPNTPICPRCEQVLDAYDSVSRERREQRRSIADSVDADTALAHRIIDTVARRYNIAKQELFGQRRDRRHSRPRHLAMAAVCRETLLTLDEVGAIFSRDHSTVAYAKYKITRELARGGGSGAAAKDYIATVQEATTRNAARA